MHAIMVYPSSTAFFERRPALLLPLPDRLLVGLRRTLERPLSTGVVRMVAHAEMTPDNLSYP